MIVNGVDTDQVRRAALILHSNGADVTMPAETVAAWFDAVAIQLEASRAGDYAACVLLAGMVAADVTGEESPGG